MPLLDDDTASQAFGAPTTAVPAALPAAPTEPAITPRVSGGGLLDDPTAGQSFGAAPDKAIGDRTWDDYGEALAAGVHGLGASAYGAMASMATDPAYEAYYRSLAARQEFGEQQAREAMTPAGREGGIGMSLAEQAPGLIGLGGAMALSGPAAPLVGAALMGAQARGDIYNRLVAQGIEPTSAQLAAATAIGAAAGVMPGVAGAAAGKIATTPLTRFALGVGGDTVTFGATGAGQEAVAQSAEIGAGKRQGYDPLAIAEAAKGGAEWGGVLGAGVHAPEMFRPRDVRTVTESGGAKDQAGTQTGGEASIGRNKPQAGVETKPRTVGAPSEAERPTAPPPPDAKVGPDESAALKGEPIAPPVRMEVGPEPPTTFTPEERAVPPREELPPAPPSEEPPAPPREEAPPAPIPEPSPTPLPAPPPTVDEPTLRQQHAELTDPANPRIAMIYNPGMTPWPVAAQLKPGKFATKALDDGRMIQYDKTKTSWPKIDAADKAGKLDELLTSGPAKEAPAPKAPVQPAVAEGRPAAAPEQPPEGVGAAAPAPAPTPEAPRLIEPARELAPVQPEALRPEITPRVTGTELVSSEAPRRTLPAIQSAEELARLGEAEEAQRRTVAENLKAIQQAEQGEAAKRGKHWTKGELAKIEGNNQAAMEIGARHFPGEGETIPQIYNRAKAMVDEARAMGVRMPEEFGEGARHGPAVMLLSEARDLVSKQYPKPGDYARFLDREGQLRREGGFAEALAARRAEGAEKGALGAVEEAGERAEAPAQEMALSPEEEMIRREEEKEEEERARERPAAPRVIAPTFKVEKRRLGPSLKRQPIEGEDGRTRVQLRSSKGKFIDTPVGVSDVRETASTYFSPERYSPEMRPMMERLHSAIVRIVGDTPVYFVSHEDMEKLSPSTRGYYEDGHIVLNRDNLTHDTALHEAFHAATAKALMENYDLWKLTKRLMSETQRQLGALKDLPGMEYAFSDADEFLTHVMTSPKVQDALKGMKISDELARDIGIPKWRRATMWNGMIDLIRQALGLQPRDTSAIEATMAITEHLVWAREPGEAMEAAGRMAEAQLREKRFQKIEDEQESRPRQALSTGLRVGRDIQTNMPSALTHWGAKALSLDKLDLLFGKSAPHVRAVAQALNKIHHTYLQGREGDKAIRTRAYVMDAQAGDHASTYDQLTRMSTAHDIDASKPPPKPTGKDAHVQRDQFWPRANELYGRLPEAWRNRYDSELRQYQEWRQDSGEQALKDLINIYDPPAGSSSDAVLQRAKANELTDEDKEHYEQAGGLDRIQNAMSQYRGKENFFASSRHGDWVVHGEYDMPAGGASVDHSGSELADNTREFKTQQEAHDYVRDDNEKGLHATIRTAYYGTDPKTGKLGRITKDEAEHQAPKGQKATPYYQVSLERGHTEFVKSVAEGKRMREAMEQAGVKNVTQPLARNEDATWSHINSADQRLIERRIRKLNVSDMEKQRMLQASREAALASRAGGLMGKHKIQRRNVLGGNYGSSDALDAYSRAHHHAMARVKVGPELDAAMDKMDAHEKENEGEADATQRSIVNKEVRSRVLSATPVASKQNAVLRNLMHYTFLNFLARPSHVFLQQMHPWIYSVPELMARHGYKAIAGQQQAMRDLMGGEQFARLKSLGKGAAAGARIGKLFLPGGMKNVDEAVQAAQGWNPIKEMIGNLKRKDERDALNALWESGHLHSSFDTSIFEGGGMDRSQAVLSQLTNAMEANNRLSTALNAYRLERDAHGDPHNAIEYARRRIETSHGVYTPTNIAPVFKNPVMRAALQFHQMPMNLAISLYHNMAKAAKGDSEARRTLAYQLGTAFVLGGMGGMPMDAPKLAGLASQALGGPSPSEYDDKFRRFLADHIGSTGANIIEEGLPTLAGPFAPVLGHRMGFDSGNLFGEPKSDSGADIKSYVSNNLLGASGDVIGGWLDSLHQLEAGNYEKAMEGALPGTLKDIAKGYRLATTGVASPTGRPIKEASVANGLLQALGFQPADVARAQAGHYALQAAIKAQPPTKGEQLKAKARQARGNVLGVPVSKRSAELAREYAGAYQ